MGRTSLHVSLNRRKNALLQTTSCIRRLSVSLYDIPVAYLLLRGSGATQNLPTMDGSSLFQKRFLGMYFRVTLFIWQRGTWWASSCLPVSWSLGLQGGMRDVRDVFNEPADAVHVQIHGNTGGTCSVIVKPSKNKMEWEDSSVKTRHCMSCLSMFYLSVQEYFCINILPSITQVQPLFLLLHIDWNAAHLATDGR